MRQALVGSTSQIAALGRNVNQIARALNGNSGMLSKQSLETLAAVAGRVDRHVDLAGAVLLGLRPVVAARRAIGGASDDAPR
jgi:Bacterial mobilisation protein (MobC)